MTQQGASTFSFGTSEDKASKANYIQEIDQYTLDLTRYIMRDLIGVSGVKAAEDIHKYIKQAPPARGYGAPEHAVASVLLSTPYDKGGIFTGPELVGIFGQEFVDATPAKKQDMMAKDSQIKAVALGVMQLFNTSLSAANLAKTSSQSLVARNPDISDQALMSFEDQVIKAYLHGPENTIFEHLTREQGADFAGTVFGSLAEYFNTPSAQAGALGQTGSPAIEIADLPIMLADKGDPMHQVLTMSSDGSIIHRLAETPFSDTEAFRNLGETTWVTSLLNSTASSTLLFDPVYRSMLSTQGGQLSRTMRSELISASAPSYGSAMNTISTISMIAGNVIELALIAKITALAALAFSPTVIGSAGAVAAGGVAIGYKVSKIAKLISTLSRSNKLVLSAYATAKSIRQEHVYSGWGYSERFSTKENSGRFWATQGFTFGTAWASMGVSSALSNSLTANFGHSFKAAYMTKSLLAQSWNNARFATAHLLTDFTMDVGIDFATHMAIEGIVPGTDPFTASQEYATSFFGEERATRLGSDAFLRYLGSRFATRVAAGHLSTAFTKSPGKAGSVMGSGWAKGYLEGVEGMPIVTNRLSYKISRGITRLLGNQNLVQLSRFAQGIMTGPGTPEQAFYRYLYKAPDPARALVMLGNAAELATNDAYRTLSWIVRTKAGGPGQRTKQFLTYVGALTGNITFSPETLRYLTKLSAATGRVIQDDDQLRVFGTELGKYILYGNTFATLDLVGVEDRINEVFSYIRYNTKMKDDTSLKQKFDILIEQFKRVRHREIGQQKKTPDNVKALSKINFIFNDKGPQNYDYVNLNQKLATSNPTFDELTLRFKSTDRAELQTLYKAALDSINEEEKLRTGIYFGKNNLKDETANLLTEARARSAKTQKLADQLEVIRLQVIYNGIQEYDKYVKNISIGNKPVIQTYQAAFDLVKQALGTDLDINQILRAGTYSAVAHGSMRAAANVLTNLYLSEIEHGIGFRDQGTPFAGYSAEKRAVILKKVILPAGDMLRTFTHILPEATLERAVAIFNTIQKTYVTINATKEEKGLIAFLNVSQIKELLAKDRVALASFTSALDEIGKYITTEALRNTKSANWDATMVKWLFAAFNPNFDNVPDLDVTVNGNSVGENAFRNVGAMLFELVKENSSSAEQFDAFKDTIAVLATTITALNYRDQLDLVGATAAAMKNNTILSKSNKMLADIVGDPNRVKITHLDVSAGELAVTVADDIDIDFTSRLFYGTLNLQASKNPYAAKAQEFVLEMLFGSGNQLVNVSFTTMKGESYGVNEIMKKLSEESPGLLSGIARSVQQLYFTNYYSLYAPGIVNKGMALAARPRIFVDVIKLMEIQAPKLFFQFDKEARKAIAFSLIARSINSVDTVIGIDGKSSIDLASRLYHLKSAGMFTFLRAGNDLDEGDIARLEQLGYMPINSEGAAHSPVWMRISFPKDASEVDKFELLAKDAITLLDQLHEKAKLLADTPTFFSRARDNIHTYVTAPSDQTFVERTARIIQLMSKAFNDSYAPIQEPEGFLPPHAMFPGVTFLFPTLEDMPRLAETFADLKIHQLKGEMQAVVDLFKQGPDGIVKEVVGEILSEDVGAGLTDLQKLNAVLTDGTLTDILKDVKDGNITAATIDKGFDAFKSVRNLFRNVSMTTANVETVFDVQRALVTIEGYQEAMRSMITNFFRREGPQGELINYFEREDRKTLASSPYANDPTGQAAAAVEKYYADLRNEAVYKQLHAAVGKPAVMIDVEKLKTTDANRNIANIFLIMLTNGAVFQAAVPAEIQKRLVAYSMHSGISEQQSAIAIAQIRERFKYFVVDKGYQPREMQLVITFEGDDTGSADGSLVMPYEVFAVFSTAYGLDLDGLTKMVFNPAGDLFKVQASANDHGTLDEPGIVKFIMNVNNAKQIGSHTVKHLISRGTMENGRLVIPLDTDELQSMFFRALVFHSNAPANTTKGGQSFQVASSPLAQILNGLRTRLIIKSYSETLRSGINLNLASFKDMIFTGYRGTMEYAHQNRIITYVAPGGVSAWEGPTVRSYDINPEKLGREDGPPGSNHSLYVRLNIVTLARLAQAKLQDERLVGVMANKVRDAITRVSRAREKTYNLKGIDLSYLSQTLLDYLAPTGPEPAGSVGSPIVADPNTGLRFINLYRSPTASETSYGLFVIDSIGNIREGAGIRMTKIAMELMGGDFDGDTVMSFIPFTRTQLIEAIAIMKNDRTKANRENIAVNFTKTINEYIQYIIAAREKQRHFTGVASTHTLNQAAMFHYPDMESTRLVQHAIKFIPHYHTLFNMLAAGEQGLSTDVISDIKAMVNNVVQQEQHAGYAASPFKFQGTFALMPFGLDDRVVFFSGLKKVDGKDSIFGDHTLGSAELVLSQRLPDGMQEKDKMRFAFVIRQPIPPKEGADEYKVIIGAKDANNLAAKVEYVVSNNMDFDQVQHFIAMIMHMRSRSAKDMDNWVQLLNNALEGFTIDKVSTPVYAVSPMTIFPSILVGFDTPKPRIAEVFRNIWGDNFDRFKNDMTEFLSATLAGTLIPVQVTGRSTLTFTSRSLHLPEVDMQRLPADTYHHTLNKVNGAIAGHMSKYLNMLEDAANIVSRADNTVDLGRQKTIFEYFSKFKSSPFLHQALKAWLNTQGFNTPWLQANTSFRHLEGRLNDMDMYQTDNLASPANMFYNVSKINFWDDVYRSVRLLDDVMKNVVGNLAIETGLKHIKALFNTQSLILNPRMSGFNTLDNLKSYVLLAAADKTGLSYGMEAIDRIFAELDIGGLSEVHQAPVIRKLDNLFETAMVVTSNHTSRITYDNAPATYTHLLNNRGRPYTAGQLSAKLLSLVNSDKLHALRIGGVVETIYDLLDGHVKDIYAYAAEGLTIEIISLLQDADKSGQLTRPLSGTSWKIDINALVTKLTPEAEADPKASAGPSVFAGYKPVKPVLFSGALKAFGIDLSGTRRFVPFC